MTAAISLDSVFKRYRKYDERNQSLKAAVLRGKRARYEEFDALVNVGFDIEQGTIFGLIGENGSGKSTLLKCIAGILTPDSGKIVVNGSMAALLELGAGFHPELSGRENVFLNGAIMGMGRKEVESRFDSIVDFAGLSDFIDAPVRSYSSGMYVRLGFAVAIHTDPDILLVDEVLAVGDEDFQRKCLEKFSEIHAAGKTIVFVSHAVSLVSRMCERVVLLEHGNMVCEGKSSDVVDRYLSGVHEESVSDGDHGVRWGTGEARADKVEILNDNFEKVNSLLSGSPAIIRIHCSSSKNLEKVIAGVGIRTIDGVLIGGVNSNISDYEFNFSNGSVIADFRIDRLMLVPNAYLLTISLTDEQFIQCYDHRERFLRFDVIRNNPDHHKHFEEGPLSISGEWRTVGD